MIGDPLYKNIAHIIFKWSWTGLVAAALILSLSYLRMIDAEIRQVERHEAIMLATDRMKNDLLQCISLLNTGDSVCVRDIDGSCIWYRQ